MARVRVTVTLKPSLLDAQGKVVQGALHQLGYESVGQVRIGKYIELTVGDSGNVEDQIREMCDNLLANPVIEDYQYEVLP
jgi:phosphoribosylformylglycinamidine synthase subunit PurS